MNSQSGETSSMGSVIGKRTSSLIDMLSFNRNMHVVMLGLDSAGKTTTLYRLKFDQYINTVPTIGFNCEKVRGQVGNIKGVNFLRSYTRCTDGIIFVIDSIDEERMEEAKMELIRTIRTPENSNVPILVYANKQDLPGAKDPNEVARLLGLTELGSNHLWHVQSACAINGEGLDEGLEILHDMIIKGRKLAKQAKKKIR